MWHERLWRFSTGKAHLTSPDSFSLSDACILVRRRQQDSRPKQVSSLKAAYALFQSTTRNVVARDLDAYQVFYRMAGLRWIKAIRGHVSKVLWLKKTVAGERKPEKVGTKGENGPWGRSLLALKKNQGREENVGQQVPDARVVLWGNVVARGEEAAVSMPPQQQEAGSMNSRAAVVEPFDPVAGDHTNMCSIFSVLPPAMRDALCSLVPAVLSTLHSIVIDLGQPVTLTRWSQEPHVRLLSLGVVSESDLKSFCDSVGGPLQKRGSAAIGGSLHHCHALTDPALGAITGITIRIGRVVTGVADGLRDIMLSGKNIAVLGFGKTTLLRDMVARLALDQQEVVMVIDTRGELGGLQQTTHLSLGHVRRIVPEKGGQASAIRAAIEKHAAKVLAIDELRDPVDFDELNERARVRGVQVIAGCPCGLEDFQTLCRVANFEIVVEVLAPASYRVHTLIGNTAQVRIRTGQGFIIMGGNG
jgi:stage III sporulation protein SpoIIIAA